MRSSLILVVGSGPYKSDAAKVLQKCGYNVKETTDVVIHAPEGTFVDARSWISRNSLRRLDGEYVKVICCLEANGCYNDSWVDVMCFVFKKHAPYVAAVLQSSTICSKHEGLKEFISDLPNSKVLETMNDDECSIQQLKSVIENLKRFRITAETAIEKKIPTAWSNEKVILFGRTGAGKSTIAQMLTLGRLDPSGSTFKASSSARGVTSDIFRDEGRGWHVTDTPGFGEAKGGTVTTKDATNIIKKFVNNIGGVYSHYVYVVKKDRINVYDKRLWEFFNKVFADAEHNFSVVVSGCTDELTAEDNIHLRNTFSNCTNFVSVNFCPIDTEDHELEEENEEVRRESLLELENGLARLGVADKECKEGNFSKESLHLTRGGLKASLSGTCSMGATVNEIAVSAVHYLLIKPTAAVGRYFHHSAIDENFFLLPQ